MRININNSKDLKSEIARLTAVKKDQEIYLSQQYTLLRNKIDAPARFISNLTSSIPGVGMVKGVLSAISSNKKATGKTDWLTNTLRLGLPLVLNRTLLKNAGWLKKSLVLLASEKAAGEVNQDKVSNIVSRITNFIRPKKKKHNKVDSLEEEEIIASTDNEDISPQEAFKF